MLNIYKYIPQLVPMYNEPHRGYHSMQHIHSLLRLIETNKFLEYVDLAKYRKHITMHHNKVIAFLTFTAWFHDCYYDPYLGSPDNEKISAKIFDAVVEPSNDDYERFEDNNMMDLIKTAILDTGFHLSSMNINYAPYSALFMDMDMHNFSDLKEFQYNSILIRKEYPKTSEIDYLNGRKKFLESLLAKKEIYYFYKPEFETSARKNIESELVVIDQALGG